MLEKIYVSFQTNIGSVNPSQVNVGLLRMRVKNASVMVLNWRQPGAACANHGGPRSACCDNCDNCRTVTLPIYTRISESAASIRRENSSISRIQVQKETVMGGRTLPSRLLAWTRWTLHWAITHPNPLDTSFPSAIGGQDTWLLHPSWWPSCLIGERAGGDR
ncbi:hypothetical protein CONLIGDRAFT_514614 [Coniochaeta ligniaria NRRL 30616]|uniref:Uncharacterized protein n=1 Tax=Coniochaeta ligniaria NRRL 30616 TaxID=1408157 RepID=A0A1J7J870_9PEZI|nr:hypothetical protein CONLIGDRAFT_514614 [Coniochaeta ligniaria NRRL 30616]